MPLRVAVREGGSTISPVGRPSMILISATKRPDHRSVGWHRGKAKLGHPIFSKSSAVSAAASNFSATLPTRPFSRTSVGYGTVRPPSALEPAREFVEDSLPVRSRAPASRRTGMIRESYHDVTPRGEFRPRACASARMCVRREERPEKAQFARLPTRSEVPWIALRLGALAVSSTVRRIDAVGAIRDWVPLR